MAYRSPENEHLYARAEELFKFLDQFPEDIEETPEIKAAQDELDDISARLFFRNL